MKFERVTHYVAESFQGKPSFIIEMSDGKSYISNGCIFLENTPDNQEHLIGKFNCEEHLEELLQSPGDLSQVTDARYMFWRCENITSFAGDMPKLIDASYMFSWCDSLVSFAGKMPIVTDTTHMFSGCGSLVSDIN